MYTSLWQTARLLEAGKVVAIPTETVYGLAANGYDGDAVGHIFDIKQRPRTSPLIVHVGRQEEVEPLVASMPAGAQKLAAHFWPGPLTLVLPKSSLVSDEITAGRACVAIRIPAHPLTQELLGIVRFPLVAPSANPFGHISPTTAAHVAAQLGEEVPILDGGAAERGLESTIVGFEQGRPQLYRRGSIPEEALAQVVGAPIPYRQSKEGKEGRGGQLSPGRLERHYAPRTSLQLGMPRPWKGAAGQRVGLLRYRTHWAEVPAAHQFVLSPEGNLAAAARRLFAGLHYLDGLGLDALYAERLPDHGLGRVMNDRLARAAVPPAA